MQLILYGFAALGFITATVIAYCVWKLLKFLMSPQDTDAVNADPNAQLECGRRPADKE